LEQEAREELYHVHESGAYDHEDERHANLLTFADTSVKGRMRRYAEKIIGGGVVEAPMKRRSDPVEWQQLDSLPEVAQDEPPVTESPEWKLAWALTSSASKDYLLRHAYAPNDTQAARAAGMNRTTFVRRVDKATEEFRKNFIGSEKVIAARKKKGRPKGRQHRAA
jgi:hypothetical protein